MTADACPPLETLTGLDRLPPGDPRRSHVEDCPRCRANLAAFRSFLDPPELDAPARLEEANQKLSQFLRDTIGDPPPPSPPRADVPGRSWMDAVRGALGGIGAHPWRALVPLGALLGTLLVVLQFQGGEPGTVLRDGDGAAGFRADIQSAGEEGFVVSWSPSGEPLEYELVIYDLDFKEQVRIATGADSSAWIRWADIVRPEEIDAGRLWRVVATRRGDEIVRSPLQPLSRR